MIYREFKLGNASIRTYVLSNYSFDPDRRRAMVIICPGGAYRNCSPREAEAVAIRFNSLGYNALIIDYTVAPYEKNQEIEPDFMGVWPVPQQELASTVIWAREHAEELNTNPKKICVLGFSAGGHLAASLGVFWQEFGGEEGRPDALVLCYPVITSGEFAHRGSFRYLLGHNTSLMEKVSLENQVSSLTPPTFIWTTRTDQSVPFQNSTLFKEALDRSGVMNELVIYPEGVHGLSLGTLETADSQEKLVECVRNWPELADNFLLKVFGSRF